MQNCTIQLSTVQVFEIDHAKILRKLNHFILHVVYHVQIRNCRLFKNWYSVPFSKNKFERISKCTYSCFYTKRLHILLQHHFVLAAFIFAVVTHTYTWHTHAIFSTKRTCIACYINLQTSRHKHTYASSYTKHTRISQSSDWHRPSHTSCYPSSFTHVRVVQLRCTLHWVIGLRRPGAILHQVIGPGQVRSM